MKKITKQAAKQIRDESLEVIKTAKKQVAGELFTPKVTADQAKVIEGKPEEALSEEETKIKQKDLARVRQLEAEMKRIREERERKEQQEREEEEERKMEEEQVAPALPEPTTRPKRGMFRGPKARVEKAKRKIEIGKSPTG